jgi:hypothetical protein
MHPKETPSLSKGTRSLIEVAVGNELVLHSPRIAILHPEGYTDEAGLVTMFLDQPHWWEKNAEWVLLHTKLMDDHFLDDLFRNEYYPHITYQQIDWEVPSPWLEVYLRAAHYATHVIVLDNGRFPPIQHYLYHSPRPKRPTKIMLV